MNQGGKGYNYLCCAPETAFKIKEMTLQPDAVLKKDISLVKKRGVFYTADEGGCVKKKKPWLADCFCFLYDIIMERSVFPRKFGGNLRTHYSILSRELKHVHEERVLELAAGTGNAVNFLPNDNQYTGTDISPGLLRRAAKKFRNASFEDAAFYVACAEDLPFAGSVFSVCLCMLSLNFFDDIGRVLQEAGRVLVPDGLFVCSVPVPERNKRGSTIRGVLYSEEELSEIFKKHGFSFSPIPSENGAVLYFLCRSQSV